MKISNAQFTVAEYVKQMQTGDIRVNKDYQRSATVWPPAARSYLIDTIIHGYPIPKLSLFQKTDLTSRTTVKEIVDGQQRSQAIRDFFEGKLRISGHSNLKGKIIEQLEAEDQQQFLSYAITADIFAAASETEIREVFRRINSYNVPLNSAETRHAVWQGDFKWFIVGLCERYSQTLKDLGVFSEQQLGRMYDAAMFSEVCQTFAHGIDHASDKKLNSLYQEYNVNFESQADFTAAIDHGMKLIVEWKGIHQTPLYKSYNIYSLLTAIGHLTRRFNSLQEYYQVDRRLTIKADGSVSGLAELASALESSNTSSRFTPFIQACAEKTNRKEPRRIRFEWMCKAINGKPLA